jgi:hypothetical protein
VTRARVITRWTLALALLVGPTTPAGASPYALGAQARRAAPSDRGALRPDDGAEETSLDATRREAAAAFADAEAAFERGDYAVAAARFEHAHRLSPHQWTLYNLALSRARAGDPLGAWHAFDELAARADDDAERREAERERDALLPLLAVVVVRGPIGARTCVDDTPLVVAAGERTEHVVVPGVHRITTTNRDEDVVLAAGSSIEIAAASPRAARDRVRPLLIGAAVGTSLATAAGTAGAATAHRTVAAGLAGSAAALSAVGLGLVIGAIVKRSREQRSRPTSWRCGAASATSTTERAGSRTQKRPTSDTPAP